jgi:ricin-type beta-trefoil lectin protein
MTDRPDDVTELVRPYVKAQETSVEPEDPEPPRDDEQPTAVQPAIVVPPLPPPPVPKTYTAHWALRLFVLVIGVAVALGIVAYFVRGGGSRDDARRGPSASLPAVNAPAPTGGAAVPASAKPSGKPSRSASSSPSASIRSSIAAPTTKPPTSRKPTLAPPPAGDRTGRISAASGRCLTLGGLLGIDGSPIETASCGGGTSQKFTLATDGTLQVADRCAAAAGDGSVRSDGCGGAGDSGQWRAGPDGSLVNPASGLCLTDPGRSGATTSVAACTGKDDQRWFLP